MKYAERYTAEMRTFAGFFLTLCFTLLHAEEEICRQQITYLMQSQSFGAAVDLYQKYRESHPEHDFELLEQMATIALEQGIRSEQPERHLVAIFGLGLAGISSSVDIIGILERGIKAPHLETQLLSIRFLAQLQDDRTDELLTRAMSSDFLMARMEAALHLSLRRAATASGQIEALMYRLPPPFRLYFSEFFAQIGTPEAITILRHLIDDPNVHVRISSIFSAALYGRDDLLPQIRAHASHSDPAEQEACLAALGALKDGHALPLLKKQMNHNSLHVRLAALRALYELGESSSQKEISEIARSKHDLFAIALLSQIPGSNDLLSALLPEQNITIRLNAALSLLRQKDPRSLAPIQEILIRDVRDLGFLPHFSKGGSLMALKVIPSARQHQKTVPYDIQAATLGFREQVLQECLELPEADFLKLAERIFRSQQTELIPLLVSLLENMRTPQALALLKEEAHRTGAPLIRAYCNLSLFRLREKGPYEKRVYEWIRQKREGDLIRFRQTSTQSPRFNKETPFDLSPEESSRLLIESYQAISDHHESRGIDLLVEALKSTNTGNRPVIAGLLLRAIQ
jgi:HEAT repeat protein